jgi:hypothetical protein
LAFIVMASAVMFAHHEQVLAWDAGWGVGPMYTNWEIAYDCHASGWYNWDSKIECEFDPEAESPEDWQTLSANLYDDMWYSCEDTCQNIAYLDWLEWTSGGPYPMGESWLRQCWWTWAQVTWQGGTSAWAKCKCQSWFLCPD